jgi:hypothetical protein
VAFAPVVFASFWRAMGTMHGLPPGPVRNPPPGPPAFRVVHAIVGGYLRRLISFSKQMSQTADNQAQTSV